MISKKEKPIKIFSKEKPIKIFSTGDKGTGLNVVKSPVKLMILSLLNEGEMDFDDIVRILDKSKSTISVHLKNLTEEGIISYKQNPIDKRKKIFYISSRFLGELEPPLKIEFPEQKIDHLVKNFDSEDNLGFSRLMFHTLRSILIKEGFTINPLLYATGLEIGLSIYNSIKDEDYDNFISNLIIFWKDSGLGNMEIYKKGDSIKINITDCFECEFLPKTGKPSCLLDLGILESLFSSYLNKNVNVIEVKCYTMGDECCLFEIEEELNQ
ncbi:MAG: ArsR family transcriptional regulator [Methanobrevibacter sp.]|nr:ArsR family transcriptional regulator [Candidatus Methanovirga aequatorialis]